MLMTFEDIFIRPRSDGRDRDRGLPPCRVLIWGYEPVSNTDYSPRIRQNNIGQQGYFRFVYELHCANTLADYYSTDLKISLMPNLTVALLKTYRGQPFFIELNGNNVRLLDNRASILIGFSAPTLKMTSQFILV